MWVSTQVATRVFPALRKRLVFNTTENVLVGLGQPPPGSLYSDVLGRIVHPLGTRSTPGLGMPMGVLDAS